MGENQTLEKKVLALKYRPKRFEDLVGQSTISQTLSLALDSNRLSHAYLFSGLRGSGKTSTARIMAKALLCSNGPTSRPCETCENCQSANTNRHLDIIEMDAASNRGIDDIKDLIEHTKYKPSSARFKVFIIDEVHMLTTQAFNALLKTLEEPPGFVKFILATTDPLKLPATILSRTQHFRFNKIASSDVMHHLSHILNEENIDFETPALEILTRSGQGSLRDTLTLLDQAIIFSKGKVTVPAVVDMLGLIEPQLMEKLFDIILKKEDILDIVKELENYEISQVCDEMAIYLKQKMLEKDARFDLLLFDRFFRVISDAKHLLALNSDSGFVLILTLLKMIEATNLKTIDEVINQIEQVDIKPMMKEAISTSKVLEHAKNDVKHAYDDKPVSISQQYSANKNIITNELSNTQTSQTIEKPVQELQAKVEEAQNQIDEQIIEVESETTLGIDTINAIPTVQAIEVVENEILDNNLTPFDEPFEQVKPTQTATVEKKVKVEENTQEEVEQVVETPIVQEQKEEASTLKESNNPFEEASSQSEVQTQEVLVEPLANEVKANTQDPIVQEAIVEPQAVIEPQIDDPMIQKYKELTAKVFERDYELGELFEKNFIYKSFENNKLQISSYAQGDDRKFLFKHFGVIKTFIYDVFGHDIELDFIKEDASTRRA